MNLIQRIEEATMQYGSDSRKAIGEFILQERNHLYRYSIQEIANLTYTSKSALVRFAKVMGYSGWKEFMKAFIEEQQYQEAHYSDIDPNYPFAANSSDKDILNQLCSLQIESLLDTADQIDCKALGKVVSVLQGARRISLFGTSPNSILGELFVRKMLSIRQQVEIPALGNTRMMACSLCQGDCAIIISYSGNNPSYDPISVIPILMEKGIPIIAITSGGDNYLRQHATYTFTISSRERLYSKISTFATETSILYILNLLFSCYFARDYNANLQYKIQTGRLLEVPRFASLSDMQENEDTAYGANTLSY